MSRSFQDPEIFASVNVDQAPLPTLVQHDPVLVTLVRTAHASVVSSAATVAGVGGADVHPLLPDLPTRAHHH